MKRVVCCFLTVALLLTGCVQSVRLSGRAIVQALGVDYSDGEYVATMQLYGQPGAGGQGAETVTAAGKTLTNLFASAAVSQGKQLFLGNTRLIVFGSSLAVEGVEDALQFLNGYHQLSPSTQVALGLGEASELLEGSQAPGFAAGGPLEILTSAQKSGAAPVCRLMDLIPCETRDKALPVLLRREKETGSPAAGDFTGGQGADEESAGSGTDAGAEKAPEPSGFEIIPAGAAILSGGKAVSYLTPEMARGLCWLQDGVRAAVVETEEPLSAAVTHGISHRVTPSYLADHVVFDVQIEIRSTLLEAPDSPSLYPRVAREQERVVAREVERFLAASCRQGYDPLELTALLRRRMPETLQGPGAAQVLKNAGYAVNVSCQVDQKGAALPNG